jgi:hypothetical protein
LFYPADGPTGFVERIGNVRLELQFQLAQRRAGLYAHRHITFSMMTASGARDFLMPLENGGIWIVTGASPGKCRR